MIFGTYAVISNSLYIAKKTSLSGIIWIVAAAANLVLNLILVPVLGIVGSAVGSLIAFSLVLGITSHFAFRELKFPIDWVCIFKTLAASGAMGAVVRILRPTTRPAIIIAVVAGIAVYAEVLILLRCIRRDEIAFLKGILIQRRDPSGTTRP